ncbi:hypothetical protein DS2_11218 [Catenovulum agarivorans DS-2]|uniref:ABC-type transport auxiliary lipoprotein component domain-containing protein n=1 Tax=Catenovulum agarivorans DS-2 TaxID=1328313 RepID=W7QP88_9ALTE|nr:ABC-type transport auxiliary lipoprotein family protein [Catenovulum agarivorans]EWH09698.1 hypothetical protein DS2_11218 [Catenovulum agarivorans DS-2]
MIRKLFSIVAVLSAMTACSSAPESSIQHYILPINSQQQSQLKTAAAGIPQPPQVEVTLAPYLAKENVVVVQGQTQVIYAHYHRWAQPLDYMIEDFMRKAIVPNSHVKQLKLKFDKLHANLQGQVTLQGEYSLNTGLQQVFLIELEQPRAGYPAMVETVAQGLQQLSEQILAHQ